MKILETYYRFECPACHTMLKAEPKDLTFGLLSITCKCTACKAVTKIPKFKVTKSYIA